MPPLAQALRDFEQHGFAPFQTRFMARDALREASYFVERLEAAGARTFVSFPRTLAHGVALLARLARILGAPGDAQRLLVKEAYDTLARLEAGELHAAVGTRKVYRGLDVPRLKSGVVVTPTAAALLRRARTHHGAMIASDLLRWMQEKLLKALFAAAQAETPTPGTHATVRVQHGDTPLGQFGSRTRYRPVQRYRSL